MPTKQPQYVYVVQDYDQQLRGVFSSLKLAADRYRVVVSEGLSKDEIRDLFEEYGENYHDAMDYVPCIVVYLLDHTYVESYDTIQEIQHAIANGEDYE